MLIQILYILCCFYAIRELWKITSKKSKRTPPYLSGSLPIFGHAWKMLGDRKHALNMVKSMSKESLGNGGALIIKLGFRSLYIISDPDDCVQIANVCLEKDYYYRFAKPLLGNGLTIAEVSVWKKHRKLMSPAFRQQVLNEFLVVFNHQAKQLVDLFRPELGKGSFNHEKYIRLNSLESICMTSFGADVANFGGLHVDYLEGVEKMLEIITERFQKVWLHSDLIYNWSTLKKQEEICFKKIKTFTNAVLTKRKAEMKELKLSADTSGKFTPFLSYLLELSDASDYSEEDILYESNTMVSAGYDTSSSTNTLVLMLLGSHPEVQAKAYRELQNVLKNSDRDLTKEDISHLVYLDAVLKETLRLYPIAPIIARYIDKDVQLGNYILKAGHGVGILIWAMHRHAMWGPDADQFRPERWLDGSLPSNVNAFGAFSFGRRSCIGKTYAMMSVKTTIVHILRKYRVTSDISRLELEIHGALKPASGQNIIIEERNTTAKCN